MFRKRFGTTLAACAGLGLLLLAGCGPRPGTLSGKVTLDDKPLTGGTVTLVNKSGGPSATAEINEDGTYTVPTFAGEYTITVDTEYLKTGSSGGRPQGGPGGGGPGGGGPGGGGPPGGGGGSPRPGPGGGPPGGNVPKDTAPKIEMPGNPADHGYKAAMPGDAAKRYMKIPSKYADQNQSGLTFTHPGGDQKHDIALSSK